MKTDILQEPDIVKSMIDRVSESMGNFDVQVRLSSADMNLIPGTLTYNIEDAVINTKAGSVRLASAGTITLDVDAYELAEKINSKTDGSVVEVTDITVEQPPDDFKYGKTTSDYTLMVGYVTGDGKSGKTNLRFSDIEFDPSPEFMDRLRGLTKRSEDDII